jgi:RNA-binding protein
MTTLTSAERRELRARAHTLHPVVSIGQHGITPSVLDAADVALKAHELIKIRVHSDDRAEREAMLARICDALGAAPVQHLGKLLIVFRPKPPEDPAEQAARRRERQREAAAAARKKVSGTTPRKPRAPHTGGKGRPEPAQTASPPRARRKPAPRKPAARKPSTLGATSARSTRVAPGSTTSLAPEAPRRRRRVIAMAAKSPGEASAGALNAPPVRRRRKNP